MTLCYVLAGICALLTVLFLIIRTTIGGAYAIITKALASFAFIGLGVVGMATTGMSVFALCVIMGLVCGLIGDILLDNKIIYPEHSNIYLNAGMASFGIGHVFYFIALSSIAISIGKSGIILLLSLAVSLVATFGIMLLSKPLKLDFGKFFYQSLAYTLILTFMTTYSITLACYVSNLWVLAIGLTLFFLSDLVLSTQYFGGKQDNKMLIWINHILYYAAQIMIACTLFLV